MIEKECKELSEQPRVGVLGLVLRTLALALFGAFASALAVGLLFGAIGAIIWLTTGDRNALVALASFGVAAGIVTYAVGALVLWFFNEASREPTSPDSGWGHLVAAVAWWALPFFGAAFKIGGSLFAIAAQFATPAARRRARFAAAGAVILATVTALQLTVASNVLPNPVNNTGRAIGMALIAVAVAVGGIIGAFASRD
jgi:hypothetical protein